MLPSLLSCSMMRKEKGKKKKRKGNLSGIYIQNKILNQISYHPFLPSITLCCPLSCHLQSEGALLRLEIMWLKFATDLPLLMYLHNVHT
jgi:hypothetical protein